MRSGVGGGGEVGEDVGEAEAALEAALGFRVDFRVHDDAREREGRSVFDFLGGGAGLGGGERAVFDDGVETLEIGASDRVPEGAPSGGLDASGDEVDDVFLGAVLPPVTDDQEERFIDIELAEGIAEIDR